MMDIKQIKELIPHRPPMLLIDRILDLEPGVSATAIKNVTINESFFQGHFPEEPIMPGVLLIEAMAQVGAVAIMSLPENKQGKLALFRGIDKAKFKRQVVPGDTLTVKVTLTQLKGVVGKGEGACYVGDELCCKALLTFALTDVS